MENVRITNFDEAKEADGAWMQYLGVSLRVARRNNPKFIAVLQRIAQESGKRSYTKLSEKKQVEAAKRAIAEAILVDWDGLYVAGKEVPYTVENAYSLLTHDPSALDAITAFSAVIENYVKEDDVSTGEASPPC